MDKYLLIALSDATEGYDQEFNEWYDAVHIPDLLEVEGCVAAQRFKLAGEQVDGQPDVPWRYATLYEMETDDLDVTLKNFTARAQSSAEAMEVAEAVNWGTVSAYTLLPVSPRKTQD